MIEKSKKKIHFGSKFLALHGRLLIASPTEFLGKRKNMEGSVAQSFYYLQQDRYLPTDKKSAETWEQDQLLATQVVEEFRSVVGIRAVALVLLFSLALGTAGAFTKKAVSVATGSESFIQSLVQKAMVSSKTQEQEKAPSHPDPMSRY
ncbi:TPA: hypothetical protein ACOEOO_001876 [Stenotrophomonas maltophilia]|uniref:hypothetical protein n=1 Tax=Stenotrophomonas maltophilia group TaxID=995085 RepID=UPI00244C22C4|nr:MULTISPECIES: hypothetical protein [Stenotrophomonas maltophilia group]MDH2038270.1 hypothetical protein [Stenotrophomonas maltophilia]MDT3488708.1 hypothetical protein [Stenotrophomonas maltophilia group sp. msm4]